MQSIIREKKFDQGVFNMLMAIKNEIIPPRQLEGMDNGQLADMVVDCVREASDKLGTPIFRERNRVVIYQNGIPIIIPNHPFEEFLAWTALHCGIEKEIVFYVPFRNQMFGRMWRTMASVEEVEKKKPVKREIKTEESFQNIFSKIDKNESKPLKKPVTEIWRQASPILYKCLVTGKELDNIQFYRFQQKLGADRFIIQIIK